MKFLIDFNRPEQQKGNEDLLAFIGATELADLQYVNLESLDDLHSLEKKLWDYGNSKPTGGNHLFSMIVGFDSPTIYLDNDI